MSSSIAVIASSIRDDAVSIAMVVLILNFGLQAMVNKEMALRNFKSMLRKTAQMMEYSALFFLLLVFSAEVLADAPLDRWSAGRMVASLVGCLYILISWKIKRVIKVAQLQAGFSQQIVEAQGEQLDMMKKAVGAPGEKGDG